MLAFGLGSVGRRRLGGLRRRSRSRGRSRCRVDHGPALLVAPRSTAATATGTARTTSTAATAAGTAAEAARTGAATAATTTAKATRSTTAARTTGTAGATGTATIAPAIAARTTTTRTATARTIAALAWPAATRRPTAAIAAGATAAGSTRHHPALARGGRRAGRTTIAVAIAEATRSTGATTTAETAAATGTTTRTAATTGAAGTATAAGTARATGAEAAATRPVATAAIAASAAIAIAATVTRPPLVAGHEVDDVVEVALLLGVRGRIFAREDAHETNVVGAITHDVEGLHEAGEAIALDAHLLLDLGCSLRRARVLGRRRGSAALGGRGLGARRFGDRFAALRLSSRLGRNVTLDGGGRLGRRLGLSARLGGRRRVRRGRDRLGLRRSRGLAGLLGLGRRFRGRGAGGTMSAANDRRFAQNDAGELGDGLHGASGDLAEKGARLVERAPG